MNKYIILFVLFSFLVPSVTTAATTIIRIYPTDDVTQALYDEDGQTVWSAARGYTGPLFYDVNRTGGSMTLRADGNNHGLYRIYRGSMLFDTSIIPKDATIKSASLNVYRIATQSEYEIDPIVFTSHVRASTTHFVRSDWQIQNYGTEFSRGQLLYNQYTNYPLNLDGVNYIKQSNFTDFGVLVWADYDNVDRGYTMTGSTFISSNTDSSSTWPYLEITYTVPDVQQKTIYDLLHELIATVKGDNFAKNIENSYMANLGKIESILNSANYVAVRNQINAFMQKLAQDLKQGTITQSVYDDLMAKVNAVLAKLPAAIIPNVPLVTQVISPYPSIAETTSWADAVYSGGRASSTGDCGLTIKQCGCAISSLSMLGKYYGIDSGFDGTAVNPLNMNNWLLAHGGYTADGTLLWNYALAYLGQEKNGKVMSTLSLDAVNATLSSDIQSFVGAGQPSLGFNATKGHYMLLKGVNGEGYFINDSFWYNTTTTDDVHNATGKVQDYNNTIDKAELISHTPALHALPESVEFVLESPAELLLTDSEGRRLGYDAETGTVVHEIPGGSYDQDDFIRDPGNPAPNPHQAKRLILTKPDVGAFTLAVIGTGSGEYHLASALSDGTGNLFGNRITKNTIPGHVDEYTIADLASSDTLPDYLQQVLNMVPLDEQKKFVQAFTVVFAQTEKGHITVSNELVKNLITYVEQKYKGDAWVPAVVKVLKHLSNI